MDIFNTGRFSNFSSSTSSTSSTSSSSDIHRYRDLSSLSYPDRLNALENAVIGEKLTLFGYYLTVNTYHLKPSQLTTLRHRSDELGDQALQSLIQYKAPSTLSSTGCPYSFVNSGGTTSYDQLAYIRRTYRDAKVDQFFLYHETVPSWVDWNRIAAGQRIFGTNALPIGVTLMNLSLIGGFGVSLINKVLESTSYLSSNRSKVYRRLLETLQFVVDVNDNSTVNWPSSSASVPYVPNTLAPGGRAWKSCIQVRLLHASVRYRLLSSSPHSSSTSSVSSWDTAKYGIPINQEDMLVTNLAFTIVVLMGLERIGAAFHLTDTDMNNYLHVWKLVGYYLGIPENYLVYFDTINTAQNLLESIVSHLSSPDESTLRLVKATIHASAYRLPFCWSPREHVVVCRALSGNLYGNTIGIPSYDDKTLDEPIIDTYNPVSPSLPIEDKYITLVYPQGGIDKKDDTRSTAGPSVSRKNNGAFFFVRTIGWFIGYTIQIIVGTGLLVTDFAIRTKDKLLYPKKVVSEQEQLARKLLFPLYVIPTFLYYFPSSAGILERIQLNHLQRMLYRRLGTRTEFRIK